MRNCPDQAFLDAVFPASKADAFFDALYGGAEEGAYDIVLVCLGIGENRADFAFELRQRPDKCLRCSLTYGLPNVFQRHPLLDLPGLARTLADKLGWEKDFSWQVGATEELDGQTHAIPFILEKS